MSLQLQIGDIVKSKSDYRLPFAIPAGSPYLVLDTHPKGLILVRAQVPAQKAKKPMAFWAWHTDFDTLILADNPC